LALQLDDGPGLFLLILFEPFHNGSLIFPKLIERHVKKASVESTG